MQWPCESVSFVVLIESEAAVCGWLSVCLSLYVRVQYASLAWQNSPLFNLPQHLVYMLFIAAQFNL